MSSPITREIERWVGATPEKTALILGEQAWTYCQLWGAVKVCGTLPGPMSSDVGARGETIGNTTDNNVAPGLTIDPGVSVFDQVVQALAKLHSGQPIVGSTSGSTGSAKRYQRSPASWCASFASDKKEFCIMQTDVIVAPGDLTHSLFSYAVIHGLYVGATVVISESFRPDRVLEQIKTHRATVLYGVPTQLKMLTMAAENESYSSVRWVLSSGARWFSEMAPAFHSIFPRATIAEFYGASELSYVSLAKHGADQDLPAGSVGRAFDGVTIKIEPLDPNHPATRKPDSFDWPQNTAGSTDTSATVVGRIWVHSDGLFDRYLSPPPADFSEKVDDFGRRWMSVGDLGYLDRNGYLFLVGRESRKIVVSGKNLYPEEVEQALLRHPAIAQAAVLGVADQLRGERLLAVVQLKPDHDVTRAALIAALKPLLDDYKVPRDYGVLAEWPMTASGKTDFAAVRAVCNGGQTRPLPA
jgi:long-chain acyl-CoA synthetase